MWHFGSRFLIQEALYYGSWLRSLYRLSDFVHYCWGQVVQPWHLSRTSGPHVLFHPRGHWTYQIYPRFVSHVSHSFVCFWICFSLSFCGFCLSRHCSTFHFLSVRVQAGHLIFPQCILDIEWGEYSFLTLNKENIPTWHWGWWVFLLDIE